MEDNTSSEKGSGSKFSQASIAFAKLSFLWLFIIFLLSLFEVIYNGIHNHLSNSFAIVLLWSWLNDLLFWFKALFILYIVFIILFLVSRKVSQISYIVL